MQAAILCLAIVAYGDTSDYIPASAATTATTGEAVRRMGQSAADRQRELDREFRQSRKALPKPLNYGGRAVPGYNAVRTVATDDRQNAAGNVNTAQFQLEDKWPNRPFDGAGHGKKLADDDPSKVNSHQPLSLAHPNASPPQTMTDDRTAQNTAPRKRYIPANASSQYPAGQPTENRTNPSARPQYVANDINGPLEQSSTKPRAGDFGYAGSQRGEPAPLDQPPAASFGTDPNFDVGQINKRYQTQSPQSSNGYPASNPRSTPPSGGVATQPSGNKYLPPSSSAHAGAESSPVTAPPPSSKSPQNWPVTQTRPNPAFNSSVRPPASTVTSSVDSQLRNTGPEFQPVAAPTNRNAITGGGTPSTALPMERTYQRNPQDVRGGNFMTLLALFGSIGLNLYLGWIAWDTYNRYQDLVADIRYTSPRREPLRDEYTERVA